MAKGDSLADQLFNRDTVGRLAAGFDTAGVFAADPFIVDVMGRLHTLELKARISHIAQVLTAYLPADFPTAAAAILRALPPPLDADLRDGDFGHFIYASLGVYVENQGLVGNLSRSLDLLEALTMRFSMEFSIRAFVNHDQTATLRRIHCWATHDNYHVRRLASEGTRPRLPWGQNVGLCASVTLPILDKLHADPTRFVTRSVANHLNDITKIDPDAVISRLDQWQAAGLQSKQELDWMRKHALRSLIKSGHAGAMGHLGYRPDVPVIHAAVDIPLHVVRGDKPVIGVKFTPLVSGPLIVDYVIDFMKFNGRTAPKVFKLKTLTGTAGTPVSVTKTHHFNATASTLRMYPGGHVVRVQVNGRIVASQDFTLT